MPENNRIKVLTIDDGGILGTLVEALDDELESTRPVLNFSKSAN